MKLKQKMHFSYFTVAFLIGLVVLISIIQFVLFENRVNYLAKDVASQIKTIQEIRTQILSMRTSVEKYIYLQKPQDINSASAIIGQIDELIKNEWEILLVQNGQLKKNIEEKFFTYKEKLNHVSIRFKAIDFQKQRLKNFSKEIMKNFQNVMLLIKDRHDKFLTCLNSMSKYVYANTNIHSFFINHDHKFLSMSIESLNNIIKDLENNYIEEFEDLKYNIEDYRDDFEGISDIIVVLDTEIDQTLFQLTPQIINHSEEIAESCWLEIEHSRNIIDRNARLTKKCQLIIGLIAISIVLFFGFLFTRKFIKEINKIVLFAKKIADGDLSETLKIKSKDELGLLLSSINSMVVNFKDLAMDVQTKSKTLYENSQKMDRISNRLSESSEQMITRTNHVAKSSDVMNSNVNHIVTSIDEIKTNVVDASDTTKEISDHSNYVTDAIKNFLSEILSIKKHAQKGDKIANQATDLAKESEIRMNNLSKAANEIGFVTKTIKRLSIKTNLIAMNANIEAASAGEYGAGFAVVAKSIQEFSGHIKKAAIDIHSRIYGVQQNTLEAVSTITQIIEIINLMSKSIDVITKSVNNQSDELNIIVSKVTSVNQGTDEITENMKDLAVSAQYVSNNTNEAAQSVFSVDKSIQELMIAFEAINTEAKEVLDSSNELSGISSDLSQLVIKFKL